MQEDEGPGIEIGEWRREKGEWRMEYLLPLAFSWWIGRQSNIRALAQ